MCYCLCDKISADGSPVSIREASRDVLRRWLAVGNCMKWNAFGQVNTLVLRLVFPTLESPITTSLILIIVWSVEETSWGDQHCAGPDDMRESELEVEQVMVVSDTN